MVHGNRENGREGNGSDTKDPSAYRLCTFRSHPRRLRDGMRWGQELKEPGEQNARLKRLAVEAELEKDVLREVA